MPPRVARAIIAPALVLLPLLSACGRSPDIERLQHDLTQRFPDCRVVDHGAGEGDDEHVYMQVDAVCATPSERRRRFELGYRLKDGEWAPFSIRALPTGEYDGRH